MKGKIIDQVRKQAFKIWITCTEDKFSNYYHMIRTPRILQKLSRIVFGLGALCLITDTHKNKLYAA